MTAMIEKDATRAETPIARHSETGDLPARAPFDFAQSLAFEEGFPPTRGEQRIAEGTLTKALRLRDTTIVFDLRSSGTPERPSVAYRLWSAEPLTDEQRRVALARISFFLSLDDDLEPFYAIAREDAPFAPILRRLHGLHHPKFLTVAEIACWSILTQHTAIPVARPMKRRLIERYGASLSVEGATYWAFPSLYDLAPLTPDDLRAIVPDERRANSLYAVVQALRSVDESWLRTAPYDEAEAWLRRIPGIGPWSAAFILLRGLGRMERMPLDMKAFLRILPRVYGPDVTMAQIAARYGDQIGHWGIYMRKGE